MLNLRTIRGEAELTPEINLPDETIGVRPELL